MATKEEVRTFLNTFRDKSKVWGIVFSDYRGKNTQALLDLDITPIERDKVIDELKVVDYSNGPLDDKLYGKAKMWVFGKIVKDKEVYIKITLGAVSAKVVCISFHSAKYSMSYPFK